MNHLRKQIRLEVEAIESWLKCWTCDRYDLAMLVVLGGQGCTFSLMILSNVVWQIASMFSWITLNAKSLISWLHSLSEGSVQMLCCVSLVFYLDTGQWLSLCCSEWVPGLDSLGKHQYSSTRHRLLQAVNVTEMHAIYSYITSSGPLLGFLSYCSFSFHMVLFQTSFTTPQCMFIIAPFTSDESHPSRNGFPLTSWWDAHIYHCTFCLFQYFYWESMLSELLKAVCVSTCISVNCYCQLLLLCKTLGNCRSSSGCFLFCVTSRIVVKSKTICK